MLSKAISISGLSVSFLAQAPGMAWGWQSETGTVANVSTNVSISISISNGDEWSAWQPGLVCPQPETGGPLSLASGYLDEPQCASHTHKHSHEHTHGCAETKIHLYTHHRYTLLILFMEVKEGISFPFFIIIENIFILATKVNGEFFTMQQVTEEHYFACVTGLCDAKICRGSLL